MEEDDIKEEEEEVQFESTPSKIVSKFLFLIILLVLISMSVTVYEYFVAIKSGKGLASFRTGYGVMSNPYMEIGTYLFVFFILLVYVLVTILKKLTRIKK